MYKLFFIKHNNKNKKKWNQKKLNLNIFIRTHIQLQERHKLSHEMFIKEVRQFYLSSKTLPKY